MREKNVSDETVDGRNWAGAAEDRRSRVVEREAGAESKGDWKDGEEWRESRRNRHKSSLQTTEQRRRSNGREELL